MEIKFRDLRINSSKDKTKYFESIERIYKHGKFIMGPEIKELENKLSSFCSRDYCVTVSSGTFALYSVLLYLSKKFPHKNKVILPSISWIATAQAVLAAGLEPFFVDTDENFFIDYKKIDLSILRESLALIAVDFTGVVGSTYFELLQICKEHDLFLIQDSAQAFGSYHMHENGELYKACGVGFASCLSINSMKLLSSHGEGGAVLTDDLELVKYLRLFRSQGCLDRVPQIFGVNGRMETLQAAMALVSLSELNKNISKRQNLANIYINELKDMKNIILPEICPDIFHTFYTFQIQVSDRDQLYDYLASNNIECQKQYPYLLCDAPHLKKFDKTDMQKSSKISKNAICLPCHDKLNDKDIRFVIKKIKDFYD